MGGGAINLADALAYGDTVPTVLCELKHTIHFFGIGMLAIIILNVVVDFTLDETLDEMVAPLTLQLEQGLLLLCLAHGGGKEDRPVTHVRNPCLLGGRNWLNILTL